MTKAIVARMMPSQARIVKVGILLKPPPFPTGFWSPFFEFVSSSNIFSVPSYHFNTAFAMSEFAYTDTDAPWSAQSGIELISLATRGLHQPALPPRRARGRRRRPLYHRPGERPLPERK